MKARRIVLFLILVSAMALAQTNPVPLINNPLVPDAVAPGGQSFALTVNGAGFVSGSTVNWNNTALATTFVSSSQLTAAVPAANTAKAGTAAVNVLNLGAPLSNTEFIGVRPAYSSVGLGESTYAAGSGLPSEPITVDLNGDGNLDTIAVSQDSQGAYTALVLLGNGNGTFQTGVSYSLPSVPYQTALGDFNDDGKVDLVATSDSGFSLLMGNGNGTFQPYQSITLPDPGYALTTGDFNGDGKLDLAVTTYSPQSQVFIVLGNGDGTFQTPIAFTVIAFPDPDWVTTGDFNGDGELDLAVSLHIEGEVAILLGNGDGTFQNPSYFSVPAGPLETVTANLNGVGNLDLIAFSDGGVSVLLGNGDGTFQSAVVYVFPPPEGGVGMIVDDLNGDGVLDLIPNSRDGISVFLGNGDGTFQTPIFFYGKANSGAAAGDFNGDGKLDLLLTQGTTSGGQVSVLLQSDIVLSPSSVDFGRVKLNKSASTIITITNLGGAPKNVTNITISNTTNYSETNKCVGTLAAGASCAITVVFKPEASGLLKSILKLQDSSVRGTQSVYLEGHGI